MRYLKPTLLAFAGALALGTGSALATGQVPTFNELDRDGDGYISRTEAMALPCLADNYDRLEPKDQRGLNPQQFNAAVGHFCR